MANVWAKKSRNDQGFTLLELVVVIVIISILIIVALNRYTDLLVVVERNRMEHDLGVMRSAISMQVADHFVAKNMDGLHQLVGSNPMELLAEKPNNYIGVFAQDRSTYSEKGIWYFDNGAGALIYVVQNVGFFSSELTPPQARFKISPVYSEKKEGGAIRKFQSGIELKELEPYRWLKSTEDIKIEHIK